MNFTEALFFSKRKYEYFVSNKAQKKEILLYYQAFPYNFEL